MNHEAKLESLSLAKLLVLALNSEGEYLNLDVDRNTLFTKSTRDRFPLSVAAADEWHGDTRRMYSTVDVIAFVLREASNLS